MEWPSMGLDLRELERVLTQSHRILLCNAPLAMSKLGAKGCRSTRRDHPTVQMPRRVPEHQQARGFLIGDDRTRFLPPAPVARDPAGVLYS